jgi:hypothetical protein
MQQGRSAATTKSWHVSVPATALQCAMGSTAADKELRQGSSSVPKHPFSVTQCAGKHACTCSWYQEGQLYTLVAPAAIVCAATHHAYGIEALIVCQSGTCVAVMSQGMWCNNHEPSSTGLAEVTSQQFVTCWHHADANGLFAALCFAGHQCCGRSSTPLRSGGRPHRHRPTSTTEHMTGPSTRWAAQQALWQQLRTPSKTHNCCCARAGVRGGAAASSVAAQYSVRSS